MGRSRGGLSTKIHAVVEGFGKLARCVLTGGQVHDCTLSGCHVGLLINFNVRVLKDGIKRMVHRLPEG